MQALRNVIEICEPTSTVLGLDRMQIFHENWEPQHTENVMKCIWRFEERIDRLIYRMYGGMKVRLLRYHTAHPIFSKSSNEYVYSVCRARTAQMFNWKEVGERREYSWRFRSIFGFEDRGVEFIGLPSQAISKDSYNFDGIDVVVRFVLNSVCFGSIEPRVLGWEQSRIDTSLTVGARKDREFQGFMRLQPSMTAPSNLSSQAPITAHSNEDQRRDLAWIVNEIGLGRIQRESQGSR